MILGESNSKTIEAPNNLPGIRPRKEVIFFSDEDTEEVKFPHLDPLVISPIINEFLVQRVLVDTGASVDIIYSDAFKNLGLEEKDLSPDNTPIKGFRQMKVPVVGTITLSVTLGQEEYTTTKKINFTVVRFNSGYNTILGRTTLHEFVAVSPTINA